MRVDVSILSDIKFFQRFEPSLLDEIQKRLVVDRFFKGNLIFSQGDVSNGLLILAKGKVRLFCSAETGQEMTLEHLSAPSLFGEVGFIDGRPREYSCEALEMSQVFILKRTDFITLQQKFDPLTWLNLLEHFAAKNRKLVSAMHNISLGAPESRLVGKLIALGEASGQEEPYLLTISQEELGRMVNLSRESVSKHLKALEDEGLLKRARGTITLQDVSQLRRFQEGMSHG